MYKVVLLCFFYMKFTTLEVNPSNKRSLMMKKKVLLAVVSVALAGTATLASAAGLRVNEQGAKAMAMGNAFAAQADDPSALFHNPAGIAFLKGTQANLGSTTIIVPSTEFHGTAPLTGNAPGDVGTATTSENAKQDIFTPISVYATHTFEGTPYLWGLALMPFIRWQKNGIQAVLFGQK